MDSNVIVSDDEFIHLFAVSSILHKHTADFLLPSTYL